MADTSSQRTNSEIIAAVYRRAEALRTRRTRQVLGTTFGALFVLVVVLVVINIPGTSPTMGHSAIQTEISERAVAARIVLDQQLGQADGVQPPQQPVGTGWTAADPIVPASLNSQYSQWSPVVTSALRVLEHVTQGGKAVALGAMRGQKSSQVAIKQGTYAGQTAVIESVGGTITDSHGQSLTMIAASQAPFTAGGSAVFQGSCTWRTTGTTTGSNGSHQTEQSGTCANVVVDLISSPGNPYSATVAHWTSDGARRSIITWQSP
jgi:hypothetical protein